MKQCEDPDSVLLLENDAAALLSISPRTLQAWRSQNEGPPFVRVGRAIRYCRSALRDWIKERTCAPSTGSNPEET